MKLRSKASKVQRAPLAAHPAFRLIVIAWLAALGGLGVLTLTAKLVPAACAAVVGGALGWLITRLATKSPREAPVTVESEATPETLEYASKVEPDRPAFVDVAELGLASLDAELAPESRAPIVEQAVAEALAPISVEEEQREPIDTEELSEPEPGKGAATVLKRQPLGQMSLVQMIERLALALDEHRETARRDDDGKIARLPSPALIEALRTLPAVNPGPLLQYAAHGNAALAVATSQHADETERALRQALEKLQRMSGGA